MFEWENDSQHQEEEKEDIDMSNVQFFNPIVIKGPDGTVSVGTASKDENQNEALCF